MKYITIILIFWQTIGNGFAQIEFKNDKEFEFSFTEYLCNSSGIGLDTVSAYQFEIRIWITKPDCLTRNLFRIYSQKNESNFHAQFFKLHVNPKINCVTRVEEPIIPDFVLDSIDLPQIFKNISLLQGGDSVYCVGIDSRKALRYLRASDQIDKKVKKIVEVEPDKLESLPIRFWGDCDTKSFNYQMEKTNGYNYTLELLKGDKRKKIFYRSPDKYPDIINETNNDLSRMNIVIDEINKLFKILNLKIICT